MTTGRTQLELDNPDFDVTKLAVEQGHFQQVTVRRYRLKTHRAKPA